MRLAGTRPVGAKLHRDGWPSAFAALCDRANGQGLLLDDFADASFSYRPIQASRREPWVGIFHHPVKTSSPFSGDSQWELRGVEMSKYWRASSKSIVGAVGLCQEVVDEFGRWLKVPTLRVLHPINRSGVIPWHSATRLLQPGYCLRDTRAIHKIATKLPRVKLHSGSHAYTLRDDKMKNVDRAKGIADIQAPEPVIELERVSNELYDEMLATSVCLTWFFGAAASNVVTECMLRGTPLITNKLPANVEYLGEDYPLFATDLTHAGELADRVAADRPFAEAVSAHLFERSKLLPTHEDFAAQVAAFVDSLR